MASHCDNRPRQSGKTTLARIAFSDLPYVSLETPETRNFAHDDPRGFLNHYKDGAIFDEIQRAPELFSWLQSILDEAAREGRMGRYILTGSQQFDLRSGISQSLAGRVAHLTLLPFSYGELHAADKAPDILEDMLFTGGYPPIYDRQLPPAQFLDNYIVSLVERDVRQILNIRDLSNFQRFVRLCAGRTGQLLNYSGLANDAGITHNSAKSWLSVLEASYIVHILPPHFANFNKRLVKSPKLYFTDTGLACRLLNIRTADELVHHHMRGAVFENHVLMEMLKGIYARGEQSNLYFWRDNNGNEVDILRDEGALLHPIEVKSGQTIARDWFKGLHRYADYAGEKCGDLSLIYGGDDIRVQNGVNVAGWRDINAHMQGK